MRRIGDHIHFPFNYVLRNCTNPHDWLYISRDYKKYIVYSFIPLLSGRRIYIQLFVKGIY